MNKISSGLLMLLAAGALGVFWVNGYLAAWIADITAEIGGTGTKTPIVLPRSQPSSGGVRLLPALPAIRPIGGVA